MRHETPLADIPVVMLTADPDLLRGYGESCTYYVTKPYKVDHVRNITLYLIEDLPRAEREKLEVAL